MIDPSSTRPQSSPTSCREGDDVLTAFAITGDHLLVLRTRAGVSSLHHHAPDGTHLADVTR